MKSQILSINIDGKLFQAEVDGDFNWGEENNCLYKSLHNIIEKTSWEELGYTIMKNIVTPHQFQILKDSITITLLKIIEELGIKINKNLFLKDLICLEISQNNEKDNNTILKVILNGI